jgi:hypothetical protein
MWRAYHRKNVQNVPDAPTGEELTNPASTAYFVFSSRPTLYPFAEASVFSLRRILDASNASLAEATFFALSKTTLEPQ